MSEEVWDGSDTAVFGADREPGDTFVRVNGSNIPINPGTPFAAAIKEVAKSAGLGKFRVFMNGTEVVPSSAPDVVAPGMRVELRPYDVAG